MINAYGTEVKMVAVDPGVKETYDIPDKIGGIPVKVDANANGLFIYGETGRMSL
jgi:hypothetical protein